MGYVNYGQEIRDPFFEDQPPKAFIEDLKKPYHTVRPVWFGRTQAHEDEVSAAGAYILNRFPDPEGLLETALADFALFGRVYGVGGDRYPIVLEYGQTPCYEAYAIRARADGCTVTAADTEGFRRAIMELEDEMIGVTFRPQIHRRIWSMNC